ncbi:MAG: protein-export chaperone SecB [Alphaproteobacteria bacterium]|jgi:preprotein translocase subunit SecB|nr:protein-export chaperone SecB [Alphaproteobacteria bacterium]
MADETSEPAAGQAGGETAQPQLFIRAQYVKDLSFENPRAPASLREGAAPQVELSVSVNGRPMEGDDHEVELVLTATAKHDDEVAFVAELTYAGVFHLSGFTPEQLRPLVMIECPRHLFPFARRVMADCTRDGGFPPLMLDPIDFLALYRRSQEAAAQAQEGGAPASNGNGQQGNA